jgi:hypothetical protein
MGLMMSVFQGRDRAQWVSGLSTQLVQDLPKKATLDDRLVGERFVKSLEAGSNDLLR